MSKYKNGVSSILGCSSSLLFFSVTSLVSLNLFLYVSWNLKATFYPKLISYRDCLLLLFFSFVLFSPFYFIYFGWQKRCTEDHKHKTTKITNKRKLICFESEITKNFWKTAGFEKSNLSWPSISMPPLMLEHFTDSILFGFFRLYQGPEKVLFVSCSLDLFIAATFSWCLHNRLTLVIYFAITLS